MQFPKGFLWGAATAAYRIEGSPLADGAGASIWHRFSHTPGTILNGDTGDVACDHYRRWQEDIEWMKRLGLNAYRFSVAWGRVLPTGRGAVNHKGLDFYKRLVDGLLRADITPMITLYHWDLPAELQDCGGWANRDCAKWFTDYACVMFRELGDRVPLWATLNEPWVISHDGYVSGCNAPGHVNLWEAPRVARNLLRAHGSAVRAFREAGIWKPEHEAYNRDMLRRQQVLAEAWGAYLKTNPPGEADSFRKGWMAARASALQKAGLPPVFD